MGTLEIKRQEKFKGWKKKKLKKKICRVGKFVYLFFIIFMKVEKNNGIYFCYMRFLYLYPPEETQKEKIKIKKFKIR